ncbi:MAG: prolipoprotein diacylglyceryl transferase [Bacteroidetes bacterium]|nr:prolipoprotein diacylglyceryl transferase [Bacteroidota bacterium]
MFPRLCDLINYLLGTGINLPVNTYGFFLAMAFLTGGVVLGFELRRKNRTGEIPSQQKKVLIGGPPDKMELFSIALIGFIAGWKIVGIILNYQEFSNVPQQYILSLKGSIPGAFLVSAILVVTAWFRMKKKETKKPVWIEETLYPHELTPMIVLIAATFGIIGAKLFDMIEHMDDFARDPIGTLFSLDGLTFYGGLILATFAVLWYTGRNKIRYPVLLDAAAPGLILAYAIGRTGCQLSGDGCWGVINTAPKPGWMSFLPDWLWAFRFPHNVIDEGIRIAGCSGPHCSILPAPVFPTSLYEMILGLIIFGILMGIRKKLTIPGQLFSIYLILNGFERFFIERIRINIVYNLHGIHLTQAEMVAILLVLTGVFGLWFTGRKAEKGRMKN